MKLSHLLLSVTICLLMIGAGQIIGDEWPQFRGPNGNGVLDTLDHPEQWSNESNLAWSVELAGGGLSSPIVHNDRVYVTAAVGMAPPVSFMEGVRDMRPKKPSKPLKFQVVCLDLKTGKAQWEKVIEEAQPEYPIHASNSYATESPACDGERLFVYFAATGTVAALDLDGKEIWRQDIGAYPTGNGFGTGSSLTTGEGLVFVQCDNDKNCFVVAFDAETGKEAWRQKREGRTSWATPLYWQNENRNELITCGSGFVTSYDPKTGEELWKMSNVGMSFSASPAADRQRIYFGNSGPRSSGPLISVEAGLSGDVQFSPSETGDSLAWSKMQAGPGMASPVVAQGRLYIPGRGILTCYSAEDGKVLFKERLKLGSMAASLWAAGDRIFLMDETGKTVVLKAGSELEVVQTNQLEGDTFWSTPAIADDSLLIRGAKKLYCVRKTQ